MELRVGRIEDIFEAYFSIFSIFRYSPDLAGVVTTSWEWIWKNWKRFLSKTCPYTITTFSFLPGVIVQEKNTSIRTPFSQKTDPSFMAENSKFCGSGGYFWPRRLNRLPKLIEMIYPIYSYNFNVKGFDLWKGFGPFWLDYGPYYFRRFLCNFGMKNQWWRKWFTGFSCSSVGGVSLVYF